MKKNLFSRAIISLSLIFTLFCVSFFAEMTTAKAELIPNKTEDEKWAEETIKKSLDNAIVQAKSDEGKELKKDAKALKEGYRLACPYFSYNALNVCEDKKRKVICYFIRDDNSAGSMALSCVKD